MAPGTFGATFGGGGEPPGDGTPFGCGEVPLGAVSLGDVGEPLLGGGALSGDRAAPGGAFVTRSAPVPTDCTSPGGTG
jgi:hypothetical protein